MEPQDLAKVIDSLIANADTKYTKSITRVQNSLYNQLVVILKELQLDSDGYILQSGENRKVLNKANNKINEVFKSSLYVGAVSNYVSVVPKIDLQNVKYFTAIDDTFKANRIFLKNLQNDTIATVEKYILRDGLQSQVIGPLQQILNQNVNSGGKFNGFLDQIRDYVAGNSDVEGRAMSYTRTYLNDTLFNYSRAFQQAITKDLKLEFYLYSGPLIEKSRPFCIDRAGQYFSHKEIESWAELDWAGKRSGTTESSIFIFAAGWNCRHQIIPVSTLIVPKEVIDRQN